LGVNILYIEPGSPWENGYIESFNGKMRDELLNREIFTTLHEARVLIEQWQRQYNQVRPHSARNNQPPAPDLLASLLAPPSAQKKGQSSFLFLDCPFVPLSLRIGSMAS
jgi:transposase InsO family protein